MQPIRSNKQLVALAIALGRRARHRRNAGRAALAFLAAAALASQSPVARAQTSVTLDGTSGSNTTAVPYSTTGNLTVSLGFFVDYLVVGGGSGNGSGITNVAYPSGGGGGGVIIGSAFEVDAIDFNLTVGSGGTAGGNGNGGNGGSSTLFGGTATGGIGPTTAAPGIGGTSASGFLGGNRASGPSGGAAGGGGGGNEGVGSDGIWISPSTRTGGTGGVGTFSEITGTNLMYGFGGGGGAPSGNFQNGDGTTNVNARANSGGGGAGAGVGGGPGADGTVIVRYLGSPAAAGGTITSGTGTATGYTLHSYTTPGAASFDMSAVSFDERLGTTASGLFSGTGTMEFDGPGRLTLTADNTYVGNTTITAGTLQVGDGGATGSLGAGDVINNADFVVNRSGTLQIAGVLSGTGSLTKDGAGTLVLSGSNINTGPTVVSMGTLEVAGNSSGATGSVAVESGSTLAGSGTLGGSTVIQNGGTLSPGSAPAGLGILSLADLSLGNSASTVIRIAGTGATPGTDFDQVGILGSGSLSFGGTLDLSPSTIDSVAAGTTYRLFDFTSTPAGNFAALTPLSGAYSGITWGSPVDGLWTSSAIVGGNYLTFDEGTGTLAVVPEPAILGAVASLGLGGFLLVRRRGRRKRAPA